LSEQRLQIGAEETTLGAATLRLGWRSIPREHFRSDPPSPLDLENAIAAIEDEIARVRPVVDPAGTVAGPFQDIAGGPVLAIEAVENAFARLSSRAGAATDARYAATLLILRELMHHLHIDRITCTSPARGRR
jgi:hypothetical protein